ncbi:MAG TPA: inositol-3-phosphate synthase [Candidatus Pacearchaeota archaeon]|jgi:myo-inositol-1-phosphate synthase|nr:inositol-3-phosphate synthase [Candidatus Pacearchaeota archaeon]HRR94595.1 inositol-3-phosphate synthase [Candidatus Paceibacterota bacterium]HPC30461.1 inositol-3-phosphate synthase [Candidatus Pacearchaeota archaeon]HQG09292.1 inositol-3-phosphate synthase [Candidatus Pacearchaeota archaeon]HQH19963.1 inositol-3-phosphate synthase [Candidatus Pacearchaeota archaeon]
MAKKSISQKSELKNKVNDSKKIKIAIAGVGNCASSLVQGIYYYKDVKDDDELVPGLMHNILGGYKISDIEVVAAFDIDKRKVGKDVSEAIFAKPNCTKIFCHDIPTMGVKVKMGPILDGVAEHMKNYPDDQTFLPAKEKPVDVSAELKKSGAQILISYMPVGSEKAVEYYAASALEAGVALVNCMPVFICSDEKWEKKFRDKGIPCIGDDIKSQVGATITHRVLAHLFAERGVTIDRSYQLNFGGNTDFLNMLNHERLKSKKLSKTEAVESQLAKRLSYDNLHIGPSDWVPFLKDNKICFIRMEGRKFGNVPVELELRLSVEDSPNSAGCVIDAIRLLKIALDRGIGGALVSPSAYFMKHPIQQFTDEKAREMVEEFIDGKRER